MNFWNGFYKQADKLSKFNDYGGIEPRDPVAAQRASAAGLMSLPRDVKGANCGDCSFYKDMGEGGMCMNEAIMTEVTPRMFCAAWSHPGAAPIGIPDQATMIPEPQVDTNDPMAVDQAAMESGVPVEPTDGMPEEQQPKEKPKAKPKAKEKEKPPQAGTVNINLGKNK